MGNRAVFLVSYLIFLFSFQARQEIVAKLSHPPYSKFIPGWELSSEASHARPGYSRVVHEGHLQFSKIKRHNRTKCF